MSAVANAWFAFIRALEDARDLQERGANPTEFTELLRHARELLDILEEEVAAQSIVIPHATRGVLTHLRRRLEVLEHDVKPTWH